MAGIYIHIPFCKQACSYCNFHFSTNVSGKADFLEMLLHEIEIRSNYLDTKLVDSIYFGGGTPSLLSEYEIRTVLDKLCDYYSWNSEIELTLEANPDDLTRKKLSSYKNAGINRLSIGVQSFFDSDLQGMNRAHDAIEAKQCIRWSQEIGITDISIDLIFGSPFSKAGQWKSNLEIAIDLDIPHLSCYALTVEPKTALAHQINSGKIAPLSDTTQERQFLETMEILEASGYEHYEISNYAKSGKYAKHNTAYWQSNAYLGLGPSAHSFNGTSRKWNIANNMKYVHALRNGLGFEEEEILSQENKYNELVMTSLRTKWGLDFAKVHALGENFKHHFQEEVQNFVDQQLISIQNERAFLTKKGKLLADGICADLFMAEQ